VLAGSTTLTVLGVFGLLAGAPTIMKVIGVVGLCMVPITIWSALVTQIWISAAAVRVRAPLRGVTVFMPGDTRLSWQQTQSGAFTTAPLVTLFRPSDKRRVSVPLVSFSTRDQRRVRQLLERVLKPH
jgi:hypothetical protein